MGRRRRLDFIEEIKAKQRNTVWPEMLANSRAVDSLAFLGDRNATPVQRIGIGLFGAFFVLAGIAFIGIGRVQCGPRNLAQKKRLKFPADAGSYRESPFHGNVLGPNKPGTPLQKDPYFSTLDLSS
jgi:hypothetical protein